MVPPSITEGDSVSNLLLSSSLDYKLRQNYWVAVLFFPWLQTRARVIECWSSSSLDYWQSALMVVIFIPWLQTKTEWMSDGCLLPLITDWDRVSEWWFSSSLEYRLRQSEWMVVVFFHWLQTKTEWVSGGQADYGFPSARWRVPSACSEGQGSSLLCWGVMCSGEKSKLHFSAVQCSAVQCSAV